MVPVRLIWPIVVCSIFISPMTFPLAWASEGFKVTNVIGGIVCLGAWPFVIPPYLRAWWAFGRAVIVDRCRVSDAWADWQLEFDPFWRQ